MAAKRRAAAEGRAKRPARARPVTKKASAKKVSAKKVSAKKVSAKKVSAKKVSAKKVSAKPKGPPPPHPHVPSERVRRRAEEMARRMPLVHFPAATLFADWKSWGALTSSAQRRGGISPAVGRFERLLDEHVFTYAGPCCYHVGSKTIGDAVIYFAPAAEDGCHGCATPFDSGALEDVPFLQPFRSQSASEDVRWDFFEQHRVLLVEWRKHFSTWLSMAYDDPERYMESNPDRYAAGQPDRMNPPFLLEENGTRGVQRHGEHECADRRAWTWEIRFTAQLPFENIAALHARFGTFEQMADFADELEASTGIRPVLRFLSPKIEASTMAYYTEFYKESGSILTELVNP